MSDSITMMGYLAYDASIETKRPAILVVHEWWGHNNYARKRADMLAGLGYTAFAVDMYGDGKTADHPKDAGTFSGMVMSNLDGAKARFTAAMDELLNHPSVDPEKTAAIGYCFGGGVVLHMAMMGVDLDGVVSFHGSLAKDYPYDTTALQSKILVCHGADDAFVDEETIADFEEEMNEHNAEYTFKTYKNAKHSFTNPDADKFAEEFGIGVGYNEAADKKSWEDMKTFLNSLF